MTFQSRFGPAEWLKPYTDATVKSLAERGVKNLAVITPGFVRRLPGDAGRDRHGECRDLPACRRREFRRHPLPERLRPRHGGDPRRRDCASSRGGFSPLRGNSDQHLVNHTPLTSVNHSPAVSAGACAGVPGARNEEARARTCSAFVSQRSCAACACSVAGRRLSLGGGTSAIAQTTGRRTSIHWHPSRAIRTIRRASRNSTGRASCAWDRPRTSPPPASGAGVTGFDSTNSRKTKAQAVNARMRAPP